jgi:hypothetical protein
VHAFLAAIACLWQQSMQVFGWWLPVQLTKQSVNRSLP